MTGRFDVDASTVFRSGVEVEESLIEFDALVQSHMDLTVDSVPPMLVVFQKSFERLNLVFRKHLGDCHYLLMKEEFVKQADALPTSEDYLRSVAQDSDGGS
jgi:hypothetical protein